MGTGTRVDLVKIFQLAVFVCIMGLTRRKIHRCAFLLHKDPGEKGNIFRFWQTFTKQMLTNDARLITDCSSTTCKKETMETKSQKPVNTRSGRDVQLILIQSDDV